MERTIWKLAEWTFQRCGCEKAEEPEFFFFFGEGASAAIVFRWRNESTDKRRKRIELPVLTIQGEKWKMKKTCDLWLLLTRFTRGKILGAKI